MYNYSSDSTLLRLVFVTEWGCKTVFKHLKSRRFFWHDKNTQGTVDFPVRFERDFTALERFERVPLQTLMFVFNSMDGSPFNGQNMRPDWNVLQIWAPEGDDTLLSQVSYLQSFPQNKCLIYVHPRHETLIHTNFQKVLKIQVRDTLKLLQALQNSLRDSTTTLRPHYQQAYDISNVPDSDLISVLPFDIRFLSLTDEVLEDLEKNPLAPVVSSRGLQSDVNSAASEKGISGKDFGKGAPQRDRGFKGSKGKGKESKGSKGHKSGKKSAPEQQATPLWKGNRRYDDEPDNDPPPWEDKRTPAMYRSQRSPVRGKGDGGKRYSGGKNHSSSAVLALKLCFVCHNLFGFNSSCDQCAYGRTNVEAARAMGSTRDPEPMDMLCNMPCHFDLRTERCCKFAHEKGGLLGHGDCVQCHMLKSAWQRWLLQGLEAPHALHKSLIRSLLEKLTIGAFSSPASTFPSLLSDQLLAQVSEVSPPVFQNWMAKVPAATDLLPILFSGPPLKWEQPSERALLADEWQYFDTMDQANYNWTFYTLDSMQALIGAWFDDFLVLNKWQETLLWAIQPYGSTSSSAVPSTFIPWDRLVAASYRAAMAEAKLPAPQRWRSENIDRLVKYYFDHNKMLDTLPKLDQIAADWADFLAQDPEAMKKFFGVDPHTKEKLKHPANFASNFSDCLYWQLAGLYKVQSTATHQLQMPNSELGMLYELIAQHLKANPAHRPAAEFGVNRNYTQKGNSMEALMLHIAEHLSHILVWSTAWAILQAQFKDSTHWWLEKVVY